MEDSRTCPRCGTRAKGGEVFCLRCGSNISGPGPSPPGPPRDKDSPEPPWGKRPPSVDDRYPRRKFDIKLHELIGWSEEKVIATLGHPNSKRAGETWPGIEPVSADGRPVVLTPSGEVAATFVFGPFPKKISFPTPYETWAYENVDGATWLLYMTEAKITVSGGSIRSEKSTEPAQRGFWSKLAAMVRADSPQKPRPVAAPPKKLKPSSPLVFADVNAYPTGAVF